MSGDIVDQTLKQIASDLRNSVENGDATPKATTSLETAVLEQLSVELYEAGVVNIDGSPLSPSQLRFVMDEYNRRLAKGGKR